MLNTPTEQKLHTMRLGVMAETWQTQARDSASRALDFDERFGMIVDAEHLYRENRKLERLLKDETVDDIGELNVVIAPASAYRVVEAKFHVPHENLGRIPQPGRKTFFLRRPEHNQCLT